MMFRFGKIIDSGNKSTRSDRFAEMSKQQQLIESKKQEIKAKFEEMKRKEIEDLNKKREKSTNSKTNKDVRTLTSSRMQSWKNDDRWRKKQSNNEVSEPSSMSNVFSNDGSFMEKYRKMAGSSNRVNNEDSSVTDSQKYNFDEQYEEAIPHINNQHFNPKIDKNPVPRSNTDGIPYPPPNLSILPMSTTLTVTSQAQSLYSLTAHPPPSVPTSIHTSLATVSASMPVLSAVASSATSLQTVSLIQVPVSGSSVILSCPLETTLVSSEPVVHLPVVHSTLSHNSMSVPLQTTVIPAQIQITSPANMPPVSAMQAVQINQSSTNVLLPQSIIVPSECMTQSPSVSAALPNTNVPPPMLPVPPPSQPLAPVPPPHFSTAPPPVYPMPGHGGTHDTSKLPPVHLPPPNFNPIAAHYPEGVQHAPPAPVPPVQTSVKLEKDGFGDERTLITSEAKECQSTRASRKREGGRDSISDSVEDIEAVARVVAECGDDMESVLSSKSAEDEKLKFLRDKQSPPYIAFRSMVEKIRKEKNDINNRETSNSKISVSCEPEKKRISRAPADQDDSDVEDSDDRRRRKRKRRSRWAPEDTKVDVAPPVVVANPNIGVVVANPNIGVVVANPNIGVATPLSLGGVVPVVPPTQQTKLPGLSGPIISQVTRTDPALLQYALKAFGTINLSEEDWKKAEDHYKINLLSQDMLKKRQELEKLQAAGRHKYAYDSDEDTEGGTWEHKLRTQEMVATQIWADELTERAKGKHHIGDFLPPDELERFMEKYNAMKQGREPDLSDYKEFKLREDNIGFQMLQKLGWSEGQGLGSDGTGIVNPVNKAPSYTTSYGLGIEKPDDVRGDDDEFDAYRKRMMLAYRFRPNPLNNPRRPYY